MGATLQLLRAKIVELQRGRRNSACLKASRIDSVVRQLERSSGKEQLLFLAATQYLRPPATKFGIRGIGTAQ
jgi:hypothetical protein